MTTTIDTHDPNLRRERRAALSGVAFVVLLVVHAGLQAGSSPTLEDPATEVVGYFADKHVEVQVGVYLQGLALIAFMWFTGSLWRHLRPAEGGPGRLSIVAIGASAVSVALVGAHIAILGSLALLTDEALDPNVVSALYLVAFVLLGMSAFANVAQTGAIGALIHQTGALPRWTGNLSYASGALWLVAGVGATSERSVWGAIGFVAFLVWLAWTATLSVVLSRRINPLPTGSQPTEPIRLGSTA